MGIRLAAALVCLTACVDGAPSGPDYTVNATLVPATAEGQMPAGKVGDGTAILPGARMITPVGRQVEVGGFLLGIRVLPGGTQLLTTDGAYGDEYLSVIDIATGTVVQQVPFPYESDALFLGLAVRANGKVYAAGGGADKIYVYDYDETSATPLTADPAGPIAVPTSSYVAALAILDTTHILAAMNSSGTVAVVDTQTGAITDNIGVGNDPYDVVYDPARDEAYVSLWSRAAVAIVDMSTNPPALVATVPVKKNPEALLLDPPTTPTRLLVTNSDNDSVSVIDLDSRTVAMDVPVAPSAQSPRGSSPNYLALSPDGSRLYVANAGENCLDVLATTDFHRVGRVPTGWYPTAITMLPSGGLVVANAKGMGGGPSNGTGFDYGIMKGTLSILDTEPTDQELGDGATKVDANNNRPRDTGPYVTCPPDPEVCKWPLPPNIGLPTPIQHVVLVIRENKTYDSALGDLAGANGDPALAIFGENITPNLHALARMFTNGDNFYSNAEASIQGHQWTAAGTANDFTEKAWLTTWGRSYRTVGDFGRNVSTPEQGYYFQHLASAGIDYIDYGEIIGFAADGPAVKFDGTWPGGIAFNLDSLDVLKADFLRDRVGEGELHNFTYVVLPNNHTEGMTPGKWTPEFMIADNDEATGRIVEYISHSAFWPSTVVFIIEDDPQDGADHVEAHRSTFIAVSPWVKHGAVVSTHYDNPSIWRTIELLLGLPPQTQSTATAAPMFDIWATEPDLTPYDHIPSNIPEARNPESADKLAAASSRMDFSTVDNAPGLGRVLWEHFKGEPAPWASMPPVMDMDGDVDESMGWSTDRDDRDDRDTDRKVDEDD